MPARLTFNKTDNVRMNVILRRVRQLRYRGRAISGTCSEYMFVASVIRPAKRKRRIILSSVTFPAVTCFSTEE